MAIIISRSKCYFISFYFVPNISSHRQAFCETHISYDGIKIIQVRYVNSFIPIPNETKKCGTFGMQGRTIWEEGGPLASQIAKDKIVCDASRSRWRDDFRKWDFEGRASAFARGPGCSPGDGNTAQSPASNHMQVAISSSIAELNSHRSPTLKFLLSSFYYLFKITDHKQLNNL